jgi:hypothetical protein
LTQLPIVLTPLTNPPRCPVTVMTVANGHGSRPNGMVETITGTPSHTFRSFAHHNANACTEAK